MYVCIHTYIYVYVCIGGVNAVAIEPMTEGGPGSYAARLEAAMRHAPPAETAAAAAGSTRIRMR